MIKILLLIFVFICTVLIGVAFKSYLKNRVTFFNDFIAILHNLSTEITFLKTDKQTFLKKQNVNKHCMSFIDSYLSNGYGRLIVLKEDEEVKLNNILNSIGKLDIDGELANIKRNENELELLQTTAKNCLDKYGDFSIKISILLGALIDIILI